MRSAHELLDEYGESHLNPVNKALHWVCVPVILWTIVALLWALPFPDIIKLGGYPLNWAILALLMVQIYYFRLSLSLAIGMLVIIAVMLWLTHWVALNIAMPLWQVAAILFVIAWIGQFIGHAVEGKRPSFFKDVQFLLIGPAWLLSFIYKKAGISI
jgi:uncharacterized membrane protein YGL010W